MVNKLLFSFDDKSYLETTEAIFRYCHPVQKLGCELAIYSIKQICLCLYSLKKLMLKKEFTKENENASSSSGSEVERFTK